MILGLDVSTSVTGCTVLDKDGKIIEISAVTLNKERNFYTKCALMMKKLKEIAEKYDIDRVYIEEPFVFFRSGGSSGKTMATLQRFNGIVSWICLTTFGFQPEHISSAKARSTVGLKIPRGANTKKAVLEYTLDNTAGFEVEYTRNGNPRPHYYDMADSWVIAKAGYTIWKNQTS